jgi:hypothetical protein
MVSSRNDLLTPPAKPNTCEAWFPYEAEMARTSNKPDKQTTPLRVIPGAIEATKDMVTRRGSKP